MRAIKICAKCCDVFSLRAETKERLPPESVEC